MTIAVGSNLSAPPVGRAVQPSSVATAQSDFETFLTLLTAQMRNQDPLEPIDSTEFVAQLAAFSTVEQQIGTNDRLDALTASLGRAEADAMVGWIGREVLVESPVTASDGPTELRFATATEGSARLQVRDQNGRMLSDTAIAADALTMHLDLTAAPYDAATGPFTISRQTTGADGSVTTDPARHFLRITEVRAEPSGLTGIGPEGQTVALAEVTVLR